MGTAGVFRRITEVLNASNVAYMLTWSFASTHYGTSRSTQDLDIVINPTDEQLGKLSESLNRNNYYVDLNSALEAKRRESLFNIIDRVGKLTSFFENPARSAKRSSAGEALSFYRDSLFTSPAPRM